MTHGKERNTKANTDMPDDRLFGCQWLVEGHKCPIQKGKSVIWRLNLPISSIESLTDSSAIEISMRGTQDNSTQFCAIIWGHVYPF